MPTSTIPLAKANLVEALELAEWPPVGTTKVHVSYGEPQTRGRVEVIVGDTSGTGEADQEWATLGMRSRNEAYAIGLTVFVNDKGMSQRQATEAAFAVFAVVEETLRTAMRLEVNGDPVVQVVEAQVRQPIHVEEASTEGFVASIHSAVRVQARI